LQPSSPGFAPETVSRRGYECLQSLFDLDVIPLDAMLKFSVRECMLIGASRVSPWHGFGVAAKRLFSHPYPL
jgi:hypothetical protein